MKKILDIFFAIGYVLLMVSAALLMFDPHIEWLVHKVLIAVALSILAIVQPLIYIRRGNEGRSRDFE